MSKLSMFFQAEPYDAEPARAALVALGFGESAPTAKAPTKPRFGVRPASAPKPPVAHPGTRAEKLILGLAATSDERAALLAVLDDLLEELGRGAAPLRALLNFSRLCDVVGDRAAFYRELEAQPALRSRLGRLLSFSQALADSLVRQPNLLELLRQPPQAIARAQLRRLARAARQEAGSAEAQLEALRGLRRAHTLRIGLLDLEGQTWRDADDFHVVVRQISDLAQVCVEQTLEIVSVDLGLQNPAFAVIAMGKLGARELNYSSDIDLIFLHDGETDAMLQLGQRLLKELTAASAQGTLYRVDMRLRPDGQSGALVPHIGYALGYYESFAAAWEWQALIKARVIAGDARLARRFLRFVAGVTWAKRADDSHLREMLQMKRRSEGTPEGSDPLNVKQGPGGIRDAEWVVQQLQMMIGPQHPSARVPDTLRALEALRRFAALTPQEHAALCEGYLFLRVLEHRLQLLEERAVRTLPADPAEKAALARRMGCRWRGDAAARWLDEEHARHRSDVRALCEHLFWGWREEAGDRRQETGDRRQETDDGEQATDNSTSLLTTHHSPLTTSPKAQARLDRLAHGTRAHPLPAPLARQVRAALPEALRHLPHAANPERALANLERLCETSGNRLSLLRALGDAPPLARAVFAILGGSEFLSDTLMRFPELLDMAAQRTLLAQPKAWPQARADCRAYCLTFRDRAAAVRRWKRREMLRIGLRDLALDAPPTEIISEISDLAQACLEIACDETGTALQPGAGRIGFGVLGMGKLGGGEMHYASDADVLFGYHAPQPFEGAAAVATRWAANLARFMGERTEEGVCFAVDARLRPHGQSGPLALPVTGYIEYFESATRGIAIWERQALTRARWVAGDAETAARLMSAIRNAAFPATWRPEWGDELRHIKSRVEHERAAPASTPALASAAAPGADRVFDVKLGRGALSDIEFCAQWLALKHGAATPALQTPNTLGQIAAARAAGLLGDAEAAALRDAYHFLRRAELRLQVTQEHSISSVKRDSPEFVAWARAVFSDAPDETATARFEAEWERHTTAARGVMERVRDAL